ncbi:DEAD/DEAH box helicase family protein [Nocardiopsis sp. FR4]|uniref:DEAD/DEAH box helicase family protein n=1 Tax=Nocardiopsis sp. FR4 TaxID=2605985 RepID=UPI001356B1CD|nr:DEAD/DEAH box helicase family protein [Nocardiopsis sp. FR4]
MALFLAADGQCAACGRQLQPGWHSDHVEAWSHGGVTDVVNGQALCPQCNLKKGSGSMADAFDLRDWQQEARERYHSRNGGTEQNFLVVATPGAGKTTFALTIAEDLISQGTIEQIVVVAPTAHLRIQWSQASSKRGIQLDHRFVNANGVIGKDFDGVAVTYQAVASEPMLWRKLCSMKRTLVVFDEIHHAGEGDGQKWGPALKQAFEVARRRLLLSGTPFRTDGSAIPFVEYEEGRAVPGYNYDYGMALTDGGVVRPAVFPAMDGESQWRRSGEIAVTSLALADTDEKTVPPALKAALDPNGQWIPSVLREADAALTQARIDTPDAGGLIVAFDQSAARSYAQILQNITGEEPAVAVSDEPEASRIIKGFADSERRWIVAVQMVAEGVDIPRLAVGVYASRIRTQMFFIQVAGRFVRLRGEDDETTARLFIPSIQPLLSYAQDIEKTVDAVLASEEKRVREIQENGDGETEEPLSLFPTFETVGSSQAVHHTTIASGESITPEEMNYAQSVMNRAGSAPRGTTPEYVALILRAVGATTTVPSQNPVVETEKTPLADQKHDVRRLLRRKVGRYAVVANKPHEHIHAELNRHFRDTAKTATLENLLQRVALIDRWLEEQK